MTSTDTRTHQDSARVPDYPMARAEGCPFDPPPGLRPLQQEGPLARVRIWDGSTPWVVTRYADQRALLADPRVSADHTRPGFPNNGPSGETAQSFLRMDDPEHSRFRRMVQSAFTMKRVAAMRPLVQRMVDGLIDDLLAGPKPADLVTALALPVPSQVICLLLGVPYEDRAFFQDNATLLVSRETTREDGAAAYGRLQDYLRGLIDAKTTDPDDAVLSTLAARVAAGDITRDEAVLMGILLLIAGFETTANMIALGTMALLEHPDQLTRMRAADDAPEKVAAAVDELLRFLTVNHVGLRRVAAEDIEYGGHTIRSGEGVILLNDIGNREPDVFTGDPDQLDLSRDARRHIAFGYGIHQCLGQGLARMELQVVYPTLLRRVPTLKLAAAADDIPLKHKAIFYGTYELPVTW
ncbi:cytochrome P450 [Streptomyces sp. NPDC002643]